MTPRQKVYALARQIGATMTELNNDGLVEVCATAPKGWHWVCSGVFELVWSDTDGEPKAGAWIDLLERMLGGLDPCDECCGHLDP